jgi:hypothetical protein
MSDKDTPMGAELRLVHQLADELDVLNTDAVRYGEGTLNVGVALQAVESLEGAVARIRQMLEWRS